MSKRIRIERKEFASVSAPLEEGARPDWETRMEAQRREWRKQDTLRYRNPTPDGEDQLLFAWNDRSKCWVLVGERRARPNRRKPMTFARLFAGFRQRFGLKRDVPLKMMSRNTYQQRVNHAQMNWLHTPPQHYTGRGNA